MTNLIFLLIAVLSFNPGNVLADQKGIEIATIVRDANNNFIGEKSKVEMILIDSHGEKTIREMESKVLEIPGDGDRSLSIFLTPFDVKGTKMLTWSHKSTDDDQWLYLPSFRRVKRINSRNKSSSFMGSEFSYEDLGSQEIEKYNYKFISDNSETNVWAIERTPKVSSGYSKQKLFISKKYNNSIKIEYFDRKGELLKIATFDKFKQYTVNKKTMWRSSIIHMKNIQTNKQSIITWKDRKIGIKHKESIFNKRALK